MTEPAGATALEIPAHVIVVSPSTDEVLARLGGTVETVEVAVDSTVSAEPGAWVLLSGEVDDAAAREVLELLAAQGVVVVVDASAAPPMLRTRVPGVVADALVWLGDVPALVLRAAPDDAGIVLSQKEAETAGADTAPADGPDVQTALFEARSALAESAAKVATLEAKLDRARERGREARAQSKRAVERLRKVEQTGVSRVARGWLRLSARTTRFLKSRRSRLLAAAGAVAVVAAVLVASLTLGSAGWATAAALAFALLVCVVTVLAALAVLGAVDELPREGFAATEEGFRRVAQRNQRLLEEVRLVRARTDAIGARLVRVDGEVVELRHVLGVERTVEPAGGSEDGAD